MPATPPRVHALLLTNKWKLKKKKIKSKSFPFLVY